MTDRSGSPAPRRSDDSGSGAVWVLAMTALVCAVAAALVLMVEVRVARAEAAAAADLSALAAAAALPDEGRACALADSVAVASRVSLVSCTPHGLTVEVEVAVPLEGPLSGFPDVRVRARAGPPGAP